MSIGLPWAFSIRTAIPPTQAFREVSSRHVLLPLSRGSNKWDGKTNWILPSSSRHCLKASESCPTTAEKNAVADTACSPGPAAAGAGERFPFQAEVKRVLDIIVHSLYTDRDVFLRELVSNAADACDKKRVLLEQQGEQRKKQGVPWKGSIRVYADKAAGTLTVEDDGIGMSRQELIDHLGTIAQSGTYKFAQQLQQKEQNLTGVSPGNASDLIGQFGVGFYSAFLVAEKVEVISSRWSSPNAEGAASEFPEVWRWSSSCGQTFSLHRLDAVAEQKRWQQQTCQLHRNLQQQASKTSHTRTLQEREQQQEHQDAQLEEQLRQPWTGTRVVLHLREDSDDYLEDYKLKDLVKKYSEFLSVPIYLLGERVEYERVPDTEGATSGATKFKTVTNRYNEWAHLNTQPPIWRRPEETLREKDYVDFYKATFKAYDDPLAFLHMAVEGQVSFRALLYVPGSLPWELSRNMFDEDSRGIRLYVRRVFINDKFQEAVPRWLTFIRGVVDSDDLPLNVGREILQKSQMLRIVHKRVAAKAVEMIQAIKKQSSEKWNRFWENYGKYLKIGAVEDRDQQEALASLVQLHSSHSRSGLTTLDEYISRVETRNRSIESGSHPPLPDGSIAKKQKAIYYLAAESRRAADDSPALEGLKARGFEVLFGVEPLDEFFLASLAIAQFKGWPVVDINKADLQLDADEAGGEAKKTDGTTVTEQQKRFEPTDFATKKIELGGLVEWLQQTLGPRVHNVVLSSRLLTHPAVLVQGQMGLSPTMQRYMQQQAAAQGVSEQKLFGASLNQPILEINPTHPIIKQLDMMVRSDPTSARAKSLALELLAVASLQGGYSLEDPGGFAKAMIELLRREADRYLKERSDKS
ncbi:heat shock protein [Cyclospora cayetanensis]|uniref:Heat shock protein n=1 Tax=Cyclospora cayetanensis TaxID=88456 RepID=A0A1D3D5M0_9EIME|nr:heat shock protein [Cyclospora cayetanensis]